MAYDEALAVRLRSAFGKTKVVEKHMFGGVAMMLRGHRVCGIVGEKLMVRVGPRRYEAALMVKHAMPMTFTGKPIKEMVYVRPAGCKSAEMIVGWLNLALLFNATFVAK